jgi:hypothetical protein
MSIQGKGNLSYKKQNVQKQNAPHTGVKNITFAHLFSNAGETTIPFDSLVTPPEWSTSGLVNPTSQSLLSAQLQVFKNNVTVTSSARGLIQKSEYIVHANRIELKNITSLVNEVFEVEVADILVTGNLIVDMQTIRIEGELADTETDFNMGYEFDVLNEEIIVFRDGIQMFRADNNDSSGATGNYYYVDTDGDGRSSLIRFFEASVGVEGILVATTGGVVDNANISTFQQIEHLQGQLDAVIPTVAALAGVPETNFRAGPNNVDLKSFGDLLLSMLNVEVPIQENWQSFTPTGTHTTNTTYTGFKKRDKDHLYVNGRVSYEGQPNNVTLFINIPDGLSIDTSKIDSEIPFGTVRAVQAGFGIVNGVCKIGPSLTQVKIEVPNFAVNREDNRLEGVTNSWGSIAGDNPIENGDFISFNFSIPIQGWESTETIRQKLGL